MLLRARRGPRCAVAPLIHGAREAADRSSTPRRCTCCSRRRPKRPSARGRGPARPQELPISLAQRRLRRLRRLPRPLQLREAQEGQARTAAHRRSRHHVRAPARRRADGGRLGHDLRLLLAHVRAARPPAVSEPRVLRRDCRNDAGATSWSCSRAIRARRSRPPSASAARDTLYGRYWGSVADFHSLHFETCYYQGIDYCIRAGLQKFEPGTQGEHKISRGFTPQATWSYHWLRDREFHAAVGNFLRRETRHVDAYMDGARRARALPRATRRPDRCCRPATAEPPMRTLRWLSRSTAVDFPPPDEALTEPNGLLAAGGDLEPERLLAAYRRGIFPWYDEGQPILVVEPGSARRAMASTSCMSRAACAARSETAGSSFASTARSMTSSPPARQPRSYTDGTWITPDMARGLRPVAPTWLGAFVRDLARRGARRRAIWRRTRPRVLRRIDVRARHRRIEGRARARGGILAGARIRPDRLPGRLGAHDQSWRHEYRAPEFLRLLARHCEPLGTPGRWS